MALGAALRFLRLGHQPLWLDESFTWKAAEVVNRDGLLAVIPVDHIAPGFYWVAALFGSLGGYGAVTLRLGSVFAGIASIVLMHRLALAITRRADVAWWAALLMALSPFAVAYSQEARGYSVVLALATGYLLLNWRVLTERPTTDRLVGLMMVSALMMWFHHAAAFVFVAMGLFALYRHQLRRTTWLWLGAHLAGIALFVPWLVLSWHKLILHADLPKPEILTRMPYNALSMVVGQSYGPSNREIREDGIAAALVDNLLPLGLLGLTGLLICWSLWRHRHRLNRDAWVFPLLVLAATNLVLVAISYVTHNLYHVRYVITVFPALVLLVAVAVTPRIGQLAVTRGGERPGRSIGDWLAALCAALVVVVFTWSNANYFFDSDYAKEDFRHVPTVLKEQMGAEDSLLLANPNTVPPMGSYGFSCPARAFEVVSGRGLDSLPKLRVDHSAGAETFVVETRQWETAPADELEATLDSSLGKPLQSWQYDGVRVTKRPGALDPAAAPGLRLGCLP